MSESGKHIDQDLIRALAKLLEETGLTEIEVEQSDLRVRVSRQNAGAIAPYTTGTVPAPPHAAPAPATLGAPGAPLDPASNPGVVLSPMVGTAYRSSEPGARAFVDIGSVVKAGDTLFIIEAMKTMNQIPAPRAGTVTDILFEDGQPVEFAEPMMIIA
jgi:acetyl-CoA carboxylase biotin carboxyl carrier protein